MSSAGGVDVSGLPIAELTALLEARSGSLGPFEAIAGEANGFATKARSFFVTLTFRDARLELFLKNVDPPDGSSNPQANDHESAIYEALHRDEGFTAPRFVGIVGAGDRYLVLERIAGWDLRYQDLDLWHEAAATLGRMHSFYAGAHGRRELSFLPRHDRERCLTEAGVAFGVIREHHPQLVDGLGDVMKGYGAVADALAREPSTLVHGDLAPKNVVVDTSHDRPRAFFVDWEWSSIGPGLIDIADLVNGLDQPTARTMLDRYIQEARGSALPSNRDEIDRSIHLAFLHRTLFRLGRSVEWLVDDELLQVWASEAAAHYAELVPR